MAKSSKYTPEMVNLISNAADEAGSLDFQICANLATLKVLRTRASRLAALLPRLAPWACLTISKNA